MQQAKRAAKAIGPVDKIISSPLQRAIQTAEAFNMEVETDENWIELDYGMGRRTLKHNFQRNMERVEK